MNRKNFSEIFSDFVSTEGFKVNQKKRPAPSEHVVQSVELLTPAIPKYEKKEAKKEAVSAPVEILPTMTRLPVKSLHDYALDAKDERDVIYIRRLEESGRLADSYIRQLPPMKEVLAYIAKLPTQPLWYKASQNSIVNTKSMRFPEIPVLTRAYIMNFMRTPIKNQGELECANQVCESERMGGFRLRQLTIDGSKWCVLCHLCYSNRLYFESLNRKTDDSNVYQIHHFMVQVEIEGEYLMSKTLMGDVQVRGLFGPYLIYNVGNYAQTTFKNGCKGWIESPSLVYHHEETKE